jgi:cation:H+ antiporter
MAGAAMTALISAKVNQWTLLVGTLPVVYSASVGEVASLPLDNRQAQEFFLTSAQSIFAVVLLLRLWISFRSSLVLLFLFVAQLFSPIYPALGFGIFNIQDRLFYACVYIFLTALIIFVDRHRIIALANFSSYIHKNLIKK